MDAPVWAGAGVLDASRAVEIVVRARDQSPRLVLFV